MSKRLISLCIAFLFIFSCTIGRCAYINFTDNYKVSDSYNSYTLDIGVLYNNIYDFKGNKLNNNSKTKIAIIRPDEQSLAELELLFNNDEIIEIKDELSKGYPIIREVSKIANTKHIKIVERINENSDNMLFKHLLDYQSSGLEKYTNKEIGSLSVNFTVDALGRMLSGDNDRIIDNNYESDEGVVISVDSDIQRICEDASKSLGKGAVVIMDIKNSRVLASVSVGDDYINRALSNYAIGSIFKIVVCACALENNVNIIYSCTNSIKVGDTSFSCQSNKSHGRQNMKEALANSCNCYFVNLALALGKDKLYKTAKSLGFGEECEFYDGWRITNGYFPTLSTLESKGQLALVGFGQGMLTDTPMHFASVVSCIANGGSYNSPTIEFDYTEDNSVLSEKTCKKLKEYMHYVVTHGTGINADYKGMTAGKTATAQSGIYHNQIEQLNTWFVGFYPYNNPKYSIVVMKENGNSGAGDCCPIFRTIVEKIENM